MPQNVWYEARGGSGNFEYLVPNSLSSKGELNASRNSLKGPRFPSSMALQRTLSTRWLRGIITGLRLQITSAITVAGFFSNAIRLSQLVFQLSKSWGVLNKSLADRPKSVES